MADKVLAQTDDDLSQTNIAELLARDNAVDYVERGMGFTADFTNNDLDVGSGLVIIEDNTEAYYAFADARTDLALTDSATNHVYVEIGKDTDDSISIVINTTGSAPSSQSVKIGEVDTANDTTTETNREPVMEFRAGADIDLQANSLTTSVSGTWSLDVLGGGAELKIDDLTNSATLASFATGGPISLNESTVVDDGSARPLTVKDTTRNRVGIVLEQDDGQAEVFNENGEIKAVDVNGNTTTLS